MKKLGLWMIVLGFIGTAMAAPPKDTQKRTGEQKILKRLAGNWAWQGKQVDIGVASSPYGPGGKFVGSSTSHLILDGKFLLVKFQEKSPDGNVSHGIGVVGFNAKKQCYVAHDFMGDGSIAVNTFTMDGRVRKGQIDITTHAGEKLLARHVDKYSPDWKTVDATWEVSLDGGTSWSHWAKFTSKKSDSTGIKDTSTDQTLTNEVEVVHMGRKWSKAEMQVWKTVKAYWNVETIDELMAYNHAEFMGWSTDEPMPSNKAATRLWLGNLLSNRKSEITTITPTGLKIHGNVAIANYYYSQLYKDMDGKQQTEQGRFTDILMKEKGKWLLVGDHGGATPTSGK